MIGRRIKQYDIVEEIGGGGMGVLYKALDTRLKRHVALKFLPPELTRDLAAKERFIREARAASTIQHPNICTIHEIDETDDGHMFICMEFYEGETLGERLSRGPLEVDEAVRFVIQAAQGLAKAHEAGMVHRDIKPANIMVTGDGLVKILDFGLAKHGGASISKKEPTAGTVMYMSPEQASGSGVDGRSDIFSLGVVLYELLSGDAPFKGDNDAVIMYSIANLDPASLTTIREDVSSKLDRVVFKALEKDKARRYQVVDEFLAMLKGWLRAHETGQGEEEPGQPSIAVLPFANMSTDKDQDHFCDGMTEDIINNLSQIAGLRVAARTSSFAFKGKRKDIREIGQHLGVETILEGGVRKAGNQLRITVQLINIENGYQMWSERYDRDFEDVFAVQDEIGRNIAGALEVQLTERDERVLQKIQTRDAGAYDFYVRGRESFHRLGLKPLERARNLFTSAFITDPEYALAYCGLADCHSVLYLYFDNDKTNLEIALTASKKALDLAPDLAESHASHGLAVTCDKRYDKADEEYARAIELSPRLFEAYYYAGRTHWVRGDLETAVEYFIKASEVRPEDYQALLLAANAFKSLNRPTEFEELCRRGLAVAETHLEYEPDDTRAWYLGAQALMCLGERAKAVEWVQLALALEPSDSLTLYNSACVYSEAGMLDTFFGYFEQAMSSGFLMRAWIENDPYLDNVRQEPRFQELVDKMPS